MSPSATLTLGSDGLLYGTAFEGGLDGYGSIFRYDPHGNGDPVVLYSFSKADDDGRDPTSQLIEDAAGNFYGVTGRGGSNGTGTIYMLTAAGKYIHLYSFPPSTATAGSFPEGIVEYGDNLFAGTNAQSNFNGDYGGAVFTFAIKPGTATSQPSLSGTPQFYSLGPISGVGSKGYGPYDGLTLGPGNLLYATASAGGLYNDGTVFSFDPATGVINDVHDFSGYDDGYNPESPLLYANGLLYGTTNQGGEAANGSNYPFSGDGTIFSIDASGAHQTLHRFHGTDGIGPYSSIALGDDGHLWLTLPEGGKYGVGLVMDFGGGTDILCASFRGINTPDHDGEFPSAGLTLGDDGLFYGVTSQGGEHDRDLGDGILFSFDPLTMRHTIIHYFGKALHPSGS